MRTDNVFEIIGFIGVFENRPARDCAIVTRSVSENVGSFRKSASAVAFSAWGSFLVFLVFGVSLADPGIFAAVMANKGSAPNRH
jgi:hypothetical protein